MSTIARYLSSALSRLALVPPTEPLDAHSSTDTSELHPSGSNITTLAHGLILSTSPYLKGTPAEPEVSLTRITATDVANTSASSYFDLSVASDTLTSSSCSNDTLPSPQRYVNTNDLFSPHRHLRSSSSLPITPSPPHLIGLGISGVRRKDGKPGAFDGLGLVGVRRSFYPRNPFLVAGEDEDEDDDGYNSPTPVRVHNYEYAEDGRDDGELSTTFMRELIFTWEADPQHARALYTIPEYNDEDELQFEDAATTNKNIMEPIGNSQSEPVSPAPYSSPSSGSCSISSLPSPLPSPPLALRAALKARTPAAFRVPLHNNKSSISCTSSQTARPITRKKSVSGTPATRGRAAARIKNPSGLSSNRDQDSLTAASKGRKKNVVVKGAWRT